MTQPALKAILALQYFHVAFLLLHDWVPLGRLSDLRSLRKVDSLRKIALGTVINTAPFLLILVTSIEDAGMSRLPPSLRTWLWIAYGLLFLGELRAWWVPYLLRPEPERATRYRILFGNTVTILPERNGISPNLLHIILHTWTFTLLILLPWM